jgi:hypothetical protein
VTSSPLIPDGEVLLDQTEDGRTRVECRFQHETLWLSQALIAELLQTTTQNITLHIKALYEEGEVDEAATCKDYLQVRQEGGSVPDQKEETTTQKYRRLGIDSAP